MHEQAGRSNDDDLARTCQSTLSLNPTILPAVKQHTKRRQRSIIVTVPPEPVPECKGLGEVAMSSPPLLICALGNPGPAYAKTLHSAAHVFLSSLARHLQTAPLSKDRAMAGLTTTHQSSDSLGGPQDWTLWQSTTLMNVSGPGVKTALSEATRRARALAPTYAPMRNEDSPVHSSRLMPRLIILHDEMREDDKPFGTLSVRLNGQRVSARGHNGIKSVLASLQSCGPLLTDGWVKVGINVGRPSSRDPGQVSNYVLGKMTPRQIEAVECAAERFEDEVVSVIDAGLGSKGGKVKSRPER